MIDLHSHILPGVDDGSKSVKESIELLRMLGDQGVDTVVATPHFYPSEDNLDAFFARRTKGYEKLMLAGEGMTLPRVLLGAEVAYFYGISSSSAIDTMRAEGSNLLLLEMPMHPWSDSMVRELITLADKPNVTLLLAHIERYFPFVRKKTVESLVDHGILIQANAATFLSPLTARSVLKLMKKGYVHFVASDCHGITKRPPMLKAARDVIAKRLGTAVLEEMDAHSAALFPKR